MRTTREYLRDIAGSLVILIGAAGIVIGILFGMMVGR